jgi:hypothetical protein
MPATTRLPRGNPRHKFVIVATRGERLRTETQRAAQRRKAAAAAAQKTPVRSPRKKDRIPNQASHNEAPVHGKRGRYEFEVSMTERPTRKSTRKSMNRQKTDNAMRIKAMSRNAEPRTRASRASRNPM